VSARRPADLEFSSRRISVPVVSLGKVLDLEIRLRVRRRSASDEWAACGVAKLAISQMLQHFVIIPCRAIRESAQIISAAAEIICKDVVAGGEEGGLRSGAVNLSRRNGRSGCSLLSSRFPPMLDLQNFDAAALKSGSGCVGVSGGCGRSFVFRVLWDLLTVVGMMAPQGRISTRGRRGQSAGSCADCAACGGKGECKLSQWPL
jgi:hypothetical protein